MKLDIFTSSLVLVLPINVIFGDFTAFFVANFLVANFLEVMSLLLKTSCRTKKVAGSLG